MLFSDGVGVHFFQLNPSLFLLEFYLISNPQKNEKLLPRNTFLLQILNSNFMFRTLLPISLQVYYNICHTYAYIYRSLSWICLSLLVYRSPISFAKVYNYSKSLNNTIFPFIKKVVFKITDLFMVFFMLASDC